MRSRRSGARCTICPVRTSTMSPGRDLEAGEGARRVEVLGHDRVARIEDVETLGPGHVEEHAPADHGLQAVDAAACRTVLGDARCRVPVVDDAAVADVGQRVPVGGALGGQGQDVLAGADPRRVRAQRMVDLDHRPGRIDPTLDEARLNAFGGREGKSQGEGLAGRDGRRRPPPGRLVDQVQGAQFVLGTPAAPVADTGCDLGERVGYRHARRLPPTGPGPVVPSRTEDDTEGASRSRLKPQGGIHR